MTIYFRTDMNSDIGAGHMVRCLSIAHACRQQGMRTVFLVSDEISANGLKKIATSDACLMPDEVVLCDTEDDSLCTNVESDKGTGAMSCFSGATIDLPLEGKVAPKVTDEVSNPDIAPVLLSGPAIILLDTYFLDADYARRLRKRINTGDDSAGMSDIKIAKIDDFSETGFPADIIINYMPDAERVRYTEAGLVLAGLSYAPLRPQFRRSDTEDGSLCTKTLHSRTVPGVVAEPDNASMPGVDTPRILISTGGADRFGMRALITGLLEQEFPEAEIVIADGSVSDMAALMKSCTAAVTAGGSTLIELCATGTPAVVFTVADNQLPQVRPLSARGVISFAGSIGDATEDYIEQEKELVLKNIRTGLRELLDDAEKRYIMSEKMRALVDGHGAVRIATALQNA